MQNDDKQYWEDSDEAFERRRRARAKRMAEQRRIMQRKRKIRRMLLAGIPPVVLLVVFCTFAVKAVHKLSEDKKEESALESVSDNGVTESTAAGNEESDPGIQAYNPEKIVQDENHTDTAEEQEKGSEKAGGTYVFFDAKTMEVIPEEVVSTAVIFIDKESGQIIAGRNARSRMNPASMTKILTVLVAAEHVDNLDDTFTITREITDYGYVNDCSAAGFSEDETVTVRDLFYGTILPSGADAGVGLAVYVAGSQEAFVEMMNEKLKALGIGDTTHFTNCVGIYDENHYSTLYDMAVILSAALDNELCREVLSAHSYTTSVTKQHPEGIIISNWFLRRIEDKDTGGEVLCAKTGYVTESGSCAASYGKSSLGKEYLCVTAGSSSSWRCIYDHVALYKRFSE